MVIDALASACEPFLENVTIDWNGEVSSHENVFKNTLIQKCGIVQKSELEKFRMILSYTVKSKFHHLEFSAKDFVTMPADIGLFKLGALEKIAHAGSDKEKVKMSKKY